jgi:hypothetical protein
MCRPKGRRYATLLFFVSLCLCGELCATTVTATLIDSTGNPIANGKVTFLIQNYGVGNIPRVQGTGVVVQTTPIVATANAEGQISATIQGNDTITPTGTYYQVTFYNGNAVYLQANYSITGSSADLSTLTPLGAIPAAPPNAAYTTIEQAGSALQQRQILNFLSGVTCADDSANSSTDCTGNGGGGSGPTLETNGAQNTSQSLLNFESGTDITATNPSGGIEQFNFTGVLAATQSATAHEWLNSYNASTGAFTATQPAFSDISGQIAGSQVPTLNQNTSGTAANLSGTPALPNGTTATTQTTGDDSTDLATDAFVLANAGGSMSWPSAAGVANYAGSDAWGTSYGVGTSDNDLVQLTSAGALPAVSAANLTNFPTLNQSTTGNAATATALAATPSQCSSGEFATGIAASGNANCGTPSGAGTVTSVGLSLPSIFSVSGSPVTGSGTLTGTLASETANYFFAAPNGSAGTPSFRAIVAADIPTLNQSTAGNAATATALAATPSQCSSPLFVTGIAASGNANCIGSQTANYFYAAPNGAAGTPTFRAIVAADVPTLNQSTSGNAATATALAATPSQCSSGGVATGITASGNANCVAPNRKLALAVASCNAGTAAPDWAPGSTAPTAACTSDNQDATLNFADGAIAYLTIQVPSDYSSFKSFSFNVTTTDTTTSHTLIFDIASYCVAAGSTIPSGPTYNTAGSVTLNPTSTASEIIAGSITSMTMTGCAAGDYMRLALSRATDTDTDTAVKFLNAPVWAYNSTGVAN